MEPFLFCRLVGMEMKKMKEALRDMSSWIMVVIIGIVFYEILEHLKIVWSVFLIVFSVFVPFIAGVALAWLLDIPVRKLEETKVMKRGLAITLVVVGVFLFIFLLLEMVIPQIISSGTVFLENIPLYINNVRGFIEKTPYINLLNVDIILPESPDYIVNQCIDWISDYSQNILSYGMELGNGVLSFVTAVVFSIYVLLEKDNMLRQLKLILKTFFAEDICKRFMHIYQLADKMMTGFIMGKLLDSLIIGILTAIMMYVLHIPFAALISVLVGVTNIIPIFGPVFGGILGALLILLAEPKYFLTFVILIIIIQQIDGHFIGPKILGDTVGLSTAWTLFAILIGGDLFGFIGMVLGVPVFAVLYALLREFAYGKLERNIKRKEKVTSEKKDIT